VSHSTLCVSIAVQLCLVRAQGGIQCQCRANNNTIFIFSFFSPTGVLHRSQPAQYPLSRDNFTTIRRAVSHSTLPVSIAVQLCLVRAQGGIQCQCHSDNTIFIFFRSPSLPVCCTAHNALNTHSHAMILPPFDAPCLTLRYL
jgi:hypothetical protein